MTALSFKLSFASLSVSDISPDPGQPRKKVSEHLDAGLRESMAANGLLQPILVRKEGSKFIIVHGERRWKRAVELNWEKIDCMVTDADANRALFLQLIENIQREDLSPEDTSVHLKKLVDKLHDEGDQKVTVKRLSGMIGKSPGWISEKLALTRLPPAIHAMKVSGAVKNSRALIGLSKLYDDNPAAADLLINEIQEGGKTVTVDLINEVRGSQRHNKQIPKPVLRIDEIPENLRAVPKEAVTDSTGSSAAEKSSPSAAPAAASSPSTKPTRKKKIRDVASMIGASADMDDAALLEAFAEAYLKLKEEAAVAS